MTVRFKKEQFQGPLFIVGFGRSGTKLLRSILNANARISIPDVESNFLPLWIRREKKYKDMSLMENFKSFYDMAIEAPFFRYMKQRNHLISLADWYGGCSTHEVSQLFEVVIKYYSGHLPGQIWGDKSPVNTRYIPAIKETFPQAKFIHIVRDVRDCCASGKKAWKSNVYRAAQRWSDSINAVNKASIEIPDDFFEIKYEELLRNPEQQIRAICSFLCVAYDQNMLTLDQSIEKIGDAAGSTTIVSTNKHKYKTKLTPGEISGIEAIACSSMKLAGYVCETQNSVQPGGKSHPLTGFKMRLYRIHDGIHHVLRNIKDKGVVDGVRFTWEFFKMNFVIGN